MTGYRPTPTFLGSLGMIFVLLAIMFSCEPAHAEFEIAPFATGAFEYQIDSRSSQLLATGCINYDQFRICTGDNPRADFKVGAEFSFGDWRNKWYIPVFQTGWRHRSNWFTGPPFNDEPEIHSESLFLEFKLGGLR